MSIDLEAAGAAATATLAAGELESRTHNQSQGEHAAACANCAARLVGTYCHGCGQSAHVHRSLWHMLEEGMHGVLHFDTKSWRTLPLLIARPGLLTKRYIHGQRVRYVSPLALFLFTMFLMFFVISQLGQSLANVTISSAPVSTQWVRAEMKVQPAQAPTELGAEAAKQAPADSATPAAGERDSRLKVNIVLPRWPDASSTGNQRLDHALRNPELILYKVKNTAYKFSFMLIPISLPFLWLMFCRRPDVAVYDHMVFSMYSLSFMSLWFVVFALLRINATTAPWSWTVLLIPPVHMFVQLRETYSLGRFAALWRTGMLLGVASTVFVLFLLAVVSISMR